MELCFRLHVLLVSGGDFPGRKSHPPFSSPKNPSSSSGKRKHPLLNNGLVEEKKNRARKKKNAPCRGVALLRGGKKGEPESYLATPFCHEGERERGCPISQVLPRGRSALFLTGEKKNFIWGFIIPCPLGEEGLLKRGVLTASSPFKKE